MNWKKIRSKLIKRLEKIDHECSSWKDSGDRGICYHYNKYAKIDRLVKQIDKNKLQRILEK